MAQMLLLGVLILCNILQRSAEALCPQACVCDRDDELTRKYVRCEGGGISIPGTVDIQSLDEDVKLLFVSGSRQNPISVDIQAAMFMNKSFEEIHLSFSNLERLPSSTFQYVSDTLEVLNLTHNHLSFAVEQNFRNLSRLTHLHLDHNRIEPVFSAMFNFLISLRVLTMSNNIISELPPRMALPLSQLQVLDLGSNSLGEEYGFPDTLFIDMPALRILRLANNSLDGLPWRSMQRYTQDLEELDLSNNRIRSVAANQLSLLRQLKVLRLAGSPITAIEPNSLNGLVLSLLDFSAGNPDVLSAGVFNGARIDVLDISDMGLTLFDRHVFLPISQVLRGLNISGNPGIALKPQMFELFPNLETLSMKRMNITELPTGFLNYSHNIKKVYLDECILVPDQTGPLSCVTTVVPITAPTSATGFPFYLLQPFSVTCRKGQLNFSESEPDFVDALSVVFSGDNTLNCRLILSDLHYWILAQTGENREKRSLNEPIKVTCMRGNLTISSLDPGTSESTGLHFQTGGSTRCIGVFRKFLTYVIGFQKYSSISL